MKKNRLSLAAVIFFTLALVFSGAKSASSYNEFGKNTDLIILIPGQTRSVMPDMYARLPDSYHVALLISAGKGVLHVSGGINSFLLDGADVLLGSVGFIGATPVFASTYSAAKWNKTIELSGLSIGLLLTGLVAGWGDINYPVSVNMMFMFEASAPSQPDNQTASGHAGMR
ncbi:MAG: hypothetical protein WCQ99_10470 [Pseudomonadota bacterium]